MRILIACLTLICTVSVLAAQTPAPYPWPHAAEAKPLCESIAPPAGCRWMETPAGTFGAWLANLPMKPGRPQVLLFNGTPKKNQDAHAAVFDIDTGTRDLQQCADACMRLRAEYLRAAGQDDDIRFRFTDGVPAVWSRWAAGERPVVSTRKTVWQASSRADRSYASFRKYLDSVFAYAGTASLTKELTRAPETGSPAFGDVFIQGGSPGHAVIVVGLAEDPKTGRRYMLLAQSYMPAQQIHVLRNPNDAALSPWYPCSFTGELKTPEWTFNRTDLKRW